ncbi:MAG: alpha/beta hydrolase [Lachnospiraceae bacterium]
MKNSFYYLSKDKRTDIHAVEWRPEGEVKAVLQICHGMAEYIDRYDEFADTLAEHGYLVVGHDHLGHGQSVQSEEYYGFFEETKGNELVIGDIRELYLRTREQNPQVPYFLLGHSMGSFLVRQYIKTYNDQLSGVIIMGTGNQPAMALSAGKLLCRMIAKFKGWKYRSKLVDDMAFGGYNKKFEPARTSKDWLSRDTEVVDAYMKDPLCSFRFTVNAYYHMFCGMQKLLKMENIDKIPKKTPILFVSGKEDPVGNFGKSVIKIYETYKNCGIEDVEIKLYEDDRHEILNEINRQDVYQDLLKWMQIKIKSQTP